MSAAIQAIGSGLFLALIGLLTAALGVAGLVIAAIWWAICLPSRFLGGDK